jgi:hypothetical protein
MNPDGMFTDAIAFTQWDSLLNWGTREPFYEPYEMRIEMKVRCICGNISDGKLWRWSLVKC